jgi:toxin ParE1/3/4
MKVRYRLKALSDIENIHRYIADRNPPAAASVVARIRRAADRLGEWPLIGHSGLAPGTFEWVVVGLPYIIVYEVDERANEVAIVAVFHGRQDRPGESDKSH